MDPGLPHGSSPWAEGPRDDNHTIIEQFRITLRVAAGLAPQTELFLHDAVGEAEQHRLARRAVGMRHPARHDKDVMRLPGKDRVADAGFAVSFDRDEHGPVSRAIRLAGKALRQQLYES